MNIHAAKRKRRRLLSSRITFRVDKNGSARIFYLFSPETRPRQREVLIEMYRKGKIAEAFRAFKKIYLEIVDVVIDHLKGQEAGHSVR